MKFIINALIALGILLAALNYIPQANAQDVNATPDGELQLEESNEPNAITDSLQDEEAPPPPEAPYPGAAEEGFAQENTPAPAVSSPQVTTPLEQPVEKKKDGTWIYKTSSTPNAPSAQSSGVEIPTSRSSDGTWVYKGETKVAPPSQSSTLEKPVDQKKDGTWYYGVKESDKNYAASFRGGMFAAPEIQNPKSGYFFEQIYEAQDIPTVFFDFEWQLKTFLGTIAAKVGSGIFYAQGDGKFSDPARQYDTPPEEFTFLMAPNTVSAIYRLHFAEKQWVVPFAEAGAGYFTFMELRDDGDMKFSGAPVTFLSAGANFLLDWLDPKAIRDLDREYGVNHVYLTAEYREILGLDDTYDFSSRVISGGIMMEF